MLHYYNNNIVNNMRSVDHEIFWDILLSFSKLGLSSSNDKQYLLEDGRTSLSYGHYKIPQNYTFFEREPDNFKYFITTWMKQNLLARLYYDAKTGLISAENLFRKANAIDGDITHAQVGHFIKN